MSAAFTFDEMLRRNEEETEHWRKWLSQRPELLDFEVDLAQMKDLRGVLQHIFIVEMLFAERIQGICREKVSIEDFPGNSVDELFAIGKHARESFRKLLDSNNDEWWAEAITFKTFTSGSYTATRRKMFMQAMTHGPWHWAQLATTLRKAGHKQDWTHDLLATKVIA